MLGEGGERNAGRLRLRRRSLRGGNADEAQALPMPPGQRLDRESRRRAGAEPDDHAVLDQLDRRLRRRALQRVAIGIGRERGRAHGLAARRGGAGADGGNGRRVVLRAEDRRAGDDRGGAGGGRLCRRRRVLAAIDLDHRIEAALRAHRAEAPDLGQHLGQEGLPAKSRIDRHHQDDVAEMQDIFDELRRARRIEHHARLLAERADLAEHPMQVDGGAGLGLDQQVIGAGLGEGGEIALRLDDHQMNVERLCRRAADGLQHDRADGDVGHETAVHHVDMDPIGAGRVDGADLLAQAREIGRQDRGRDEDRRRRPR